MTVVIMTVVPVTTLLRGQLMPITTLLPLVWSLSVIIIPLMKDLIIDTPSLTAPAQLEGKFAFHQASALPSNLYTANLVLNASSQPITSKIFSIITLLTSTSFLKLLLASQHPSSNALAQLEGKTNWYGTPRESLHESGEAMSTRRFERQPKGQRRIRWSKTRTELLANPGVNLGKQCLQGVLNGRRKVGV
nr:hypothetical protein [Tanacetum cinerariifolium]